MPLKPLDVMNCRRRFPALARKFGDEPVVYFDGPAGSQVPQSVIDAVSGYLSDTNSNHGGVFATSRESDEVLGQAHQAVADLLGTRDPDQVIFGPNMTTLTFSLSRAIGRTWRAGDEVIVTQLDHDANYTPWVLAARDAGATINCVSIRPEDCTLDMDDLERKLTKRTRLIAVSCASNALGSVTPVQKIIQMAHEVGAQVFLDAVHYAPHLLMAVEDWDCDYLVCSVYKFFGPHVGVLWGKRNLLENLPAYKLRPTSNALPGRWMTGTQNHEGIAGTHAAVEYLADLGWMAGAETSDRRGALEAAFSAISDHERILAEHLIRRLSELPDYKVWGITDLDRLRDRVPTVSVTHSRLSPKSVAESLARQGIFVWHGNFYALPLTECLSLEPEGMIRIGLLHYNTIEEIDRLALALGEL